MSYDPIFPTIKGILRKLGGDIETRKYRLGSIEGKTKIEIESVPLYKVSDEIPDIKSFIRGSGILGGEELNFTIESFTVVDLGWVLIMGIGPNAPIGAVVYSDEANFETGVYFTYYDEENRTFYIEFAETVHPIDPKYLPGVCLPVVEISQETMAGVFSSGTATCTAKEHAIIWGAYQALSPLIIKGNYNGIAFSGVSNILLDSAYTPYFEANAGALKVMVSFDDKTAKIRSVQQ